MRAPLRSVKVRAALAVAAVGVLVAGYLLRPRAELPAPALEEQPSPILREVVTRRETTGMFAALQDTARDVVHLTVRLTVPEPPLERWSDWAPDAPPQDTMRFGVPIDGDRVLGDAADLPEGTRVNIGFADGRTVSGFVIVRFPASRLALIAADGGGGWPVPIPAAAPADSGDLVVGVAPGEEGPVTAPLIVAESAGGTMRITSVAERFLGIPVFAAGGDWLGVLAAGPDGMRIISADAVLAERPPAAAPAPVGVTLRSVAADDGARRVVVEAVAPDGRAAEAGLRAGDVLLSVQDDPVTTLDAAAGALQREASAALRLDVRRGARTLTIRIPAPVGTL